MIVSYEIENARNTVEFGEWSAQQSREYVWGAIDHTHMVSCVSVCMWMVFYRIFLDLRMKKVKLDFLNGCLCGRLVVSMFRLSECASELESLIQTSISTD